MRVKLQQLLVLTGLLVCFIPFSFGKPITYVIDPDHTFPTFEADHMGGLSLWRGRINSTTGEIILDPSDHLEVGVTAGGVESDQPRENIVAKQI